MNAQVGKMQIIRGYGSGKESVMGKIQSLSQLRRNTEKDEEALSDWESFSRAVGIAVSRIGELKEHLRDMMPVPVESCLEDMLSFLRSRDFLAETRDMIDGGISATAAVEHIGAERESDAVVGEVCLLLLGILQGDSVEYTPDEGIVIALCRETLDVTAILPIVRAEISGLVCVGDENCLARKIAESLRLPSLFVSAEDADNIHSDERVILSPERGMLIVDPDIEAVDEFLSEIRESDSEESSGTFFGEKIYRVLDLKMQQSRGLIVDVGKSERAEKELFVVYRRVAERVGRGYGTVVVRAGEELYEHLRAVARAAVYGRLSVAVSVRSADDFELVRETFSCVCEELLREGREFEESVSIGAAIDTARGALLVDRIAERADFLLIDTESLIGLQSDSEGDKATERLLRLMFTIGTGKIERLTALGDMRLLRERIEKIFSERSAEPPRCLLSGK